MAGSLPLAKGFRIFGKAEDGTCPPPRRARRPFALIDEAVTVYTDGSCVDNGGTNARAGAGVWYGESDGRNIAVAVPGNAPTNQTAELYAVARAVLATPPFAPLRIISDSRFVVDGLTEHLPRWEDRGWYGMRDKHLLKATVALLRRRSAETHFKWVKGHTGIIGNEGADALASIGVDAHTDGNPVILPEPGRNVHDSVKLSALTQSLAYKCIRGSNDPCTRRRTDLNIDMAIAALEDDWKMHVSPAKIWKGLMDKDVRRKYRMFLWKAIHGVHKIGSYWDNIPGYEHRAMCTTCGVVESMDHILLECSAKCVQLIWDMCADMLRKAGADIPLLRIGSIYASPILTLKKLHDDATVGMDRLARILIMESVHLIWKMRCERVISEDFVPEVSHGREETTARWENVVNERLRMDCALTKVRTKITTVSKDLVLGTWTKVLHDYKSLPQDWTNLQGVLVGSSGRRARGVG
ncbi:ribonuclease H-like protein [Trametes sanguinea]|nr:ribonuclease H-like protein [Trametes sanguinea]